MMKKLLAPALLAIAPQAFADPKDFNSEMDNAPFVSARAAGLGQALSPIANGLDAFYYNPALIGGVHEKAAKPMLTHLYIPYIATETSPGSHGFMTKRLTGSSMSSNEIAEKISDVWNNKSYYERVSATPVVVINRLMAGYTYSSRSSANLDNSDSANPLLQVSERTTSGPIVGFSATAPKQEFYLGVSVSFLTIRDTAANWSAADFASRETRLPVLKEGTERYEGMPIHIGSAYRFAHAWKPAITMVMQDVGSTRYSPADKTKDTRVQRDNFTMGFGISPSLSTIGQLNVVSELTSLTNSSVKFADKLRLSSEFTMGDRFGADAGLSFRLAYTSAGMNYGAGINLGILHAEVASYAEDVGKDMHKMVERRSVVNLGINIADY